MSVYFARLGKYLKVGYSENPERRVRNLFSSETAYAAPWDCSRRRSDRHLIGCVPGDTGDERTAHLSLDQFAVGCEFFLAEPAALAYIDRCISAGRVVSASVVRPEGFAELVGQVEPESADVTEQMRLMAECIGRGFPHVALTVAESHGQRTRGTRSAS